MTEYRGPRRLEIYEIEFGQAWPEEISARHPALIVSHQALIDRAHGLLTVIPGTSKVPPGKSPTILEVKPTKLNGLKKTTYFKAEQIRSIDFPQRVRTRYGTLEPELEGQLINTIAVSLDML